MIERGASMRCRLCLPSALLLLSGCATTGGDRIAQKDPLEGFNRHVWNFNHGVDKAVVRPIAVAYRGVTPSFARRGIGNAFDNLTEPWSAINNLLQLKPGRAARNLGRFAVNSTIGIAGLSDRATKIGIRQAPEDAGQTLARWGVGTGPYLVLPLLGPSTLRDGVGFAVAQVADPVAICFAQCGVPSGVRYGLATLKYLNARSELIDVGADAMLATSLDPYAVARSAYLQRRREEILNESPDADSGPAGAPSDASVSTSASDSR
ncbi:MlaA family lipoprotein [Sphingomonas nostoxanthinifaciens]|uniref:MlaA family lipoprotein n=1 Tax=Sphingomonas nostoxanthinifaciens TaxID=2872652 RepID=UPI001CC1DCC6|nr:VacJ family lipoprotein [Sphingomonas nostoxanthinifaciens]UAK25783.1 VacJ family lipoprotein [Sphingomonas nostoxanthinifaciens]